MPTRSSYKQGTPSWVDLSTTDPEAAKVFYAGLFGWEFEDMPTAEGGIYSMAKLRGEYVAAASAMPPDVPEDLPPVWNTYLAVDDVDAATARVTSAGGRVLAGPFDIDPSGRMAFVVDPVGAAVGLWQAGTHIGAGLVNEAGTLIWNELITAAPDEALPFYEAVLGLTGTTTDMAGGQYTVLQVGEDQVGGCARPRVPGIPAHWHVYFATENADDTVAAIRASGGKVLAEPFDVPEVGRMAVVSDPQGAVFSVIQPPAGQ
ncbi:VOC family protein [Rhodococcus sp. UNC363MFTsu5.1]|uniref:VOC family protein n=1 Tax=Rhodococcus sp. UNC363MFTsu5.1 TaxID=1449069 RepID=UPI0004819CD2|nr:VOC family protein [Rhodococcus sp. UNC363MFTsu5.1]